MVEPRPARTHRPICGRVLSVVSTAVSVKSEALKLSSSCISDSPVRSNVNHFQPAATVAGLDNAQSLHHFLSESPWLCQHFRQQRLQLILQTLGKREIVLVIDDTGDRKKGQHTDYVKRQYIGNLGKIENGIVAVTAYGVMGNITLPLLFKVYKPKERLKRRRYLPKQA